MGAKGKSTQRGSGWEGRKGGGVRRQERGGRGEEGGGEEGGKSEQGVGREGIAREEGSGQKGGRGRGRDERKEGED